MHIQLSSWDEDDFYEKNMFVNEIYNFLVLSFLSWDW
jgi:hypothetical protein